MSVQRALSLLQSARFAAPLACAAAVAEVRAQYGLELGKARARCGFSRGHLLDVVLYVPGGSGAARETAAAEALVSRVIGEELFERWVGSVTATPTVRGGPLTVLNTTTEERSALPLETLPDTVRAAIAGVQLGLPPLPAPDAADRADWIAFELEPVLAPDYAAQDDLVVCSTRMPELKKSFLHGEPFFSGRFDNSGALFTYLKFQAKTQDPEQRLAERAKLEAITQQALGAASGVVIGLGLGARYSYLDLALREPSCVAERLMPALREARISERAWLLFCDSELEREYVPVHEHSPEPFWG